MRVVRTLHPSSLHQPHPPSTLSSKHLDCFSFLPKSPPRCLGLKAVEREAAAPLVPPLSTSPTGAQSAAAVARTDWRLVAQPGAHRQSDMLGDPSGTPDLERARAQLSSAHRAGRFASLEGTAAGGQNPALPLAHAGVRAPTSLRGRIPPLSNRVQLSPNRWRACVCYAGGSSGAGASVDLDDGASDVGEASQAHLTSTSNGKKRERREADPENSVANPSKLPGTLAHCLAHCLA